MDACVRVQSYGEPAAKAAFMNQLMPRGACITRRTRHLSRRSSACCSACCSASAEAEAAAEAELTVCRPLTSRCASPLLQQRAVDIASVSRNWAGASARASCRPRWDITSRCRIVPAFRPWFACGQCSGLCAPTACSHIGVGKGMHAIHALPCTRPGVVCDGMVSPLHAGIVCSGPYNSRPMPAPCSPLLPAPAAPHPFPPCGCVSSPGSWVPFLHPHTLVYVRTCATPTCTAGRGRAPRRQRRYHS